MRIVIFLFAFFLSSCSYTPMNVAASSYLGDSINLQTIINRAEPKESIALNDRFTNYLEHYLHKTISKNADSTIILKLLNSEFIPLYYDDLGNAKSYKAIVSLEFDVKFKIGKKRVIITKGEYVFDTNSVSVLSDEQKTKAIDIASQKAFDEFVLKIIL